MDVDIGKAVFICSASALYSTGHWIGATVLVALLIINQFKEG